MAEEKAVVPAKAGRSVLAESLVVAPSVVGLPLAPPLRRLLAMAVDLTAVALLSMLSGPWLGLGTGIMLILLFGNSATASLALKAVRHVCRVLGGILVLLSALALGHVSLVRSSALNLDVFTGREESPAMRESVFLPSTGGTAEWRTAAERLQNQVEQLKQENRDLRAASTSWLFQARTFANALGVTFGWSGVYFTLLGGALRGRTLGKLALGIRPVKLSGTEFTFFDAFVRHGGYVAGVAMGLIGFLKLLWDPNRQAVEDRIAGTVVVRS